MGIRIPTWAGAMVAGAVATTFGLVALIEGEILVGVILLATAALLLWGAWWLAVEKPERDQERRSARRGRQHHP